MAKDTEKRPKTLEEASKEFNDALENLANVLYEEFRFDDVTKAIEKLYAEYRKYAGDVKKYIRRVAHHRKLSQRNNESRKGR